MTIINTSCSPRDGCERLATQDGLLELTRISFFPLIKIAIELKLQYIKKRLTYKKKATIPQKKEKKTKHIEKRIKSINIYKVINAHTFVHTSCV